jgi:hypothetical protein
MKKLSWILLAICLVAMPASASTFVAMTAQEMIAEADAVVQGRVVELESFWTESGRIIKTEATVEVEETLLGRAPRTVTVTTFGGQVGEMMVEAHGFPVFEKNEHVLLFLKAEPADDTIRVLGYKQGQFRVVTRRDGVTLAVPMLDDTDRYLTPNGKMLPEPQSVELGDFKARVRSIAKSLNRSVQQ